MKEGDSSKSIDDIFASVSRLGRKAGAPEATVDLPIGKRDDEALTTSSASTIAPVAKASATADGAVAAPGDAAVPTPDNLPLDAGTGDEGDLVERPHRTEGHDPFPERALSGRTEAQESEPEDSGVAEEQRRAVEQAAASQAAQARRRALAEDRARFAPAAEEESGAAEQAPAPAHERARAGESARLDELTEEECWAAEQAAAQLALLARHRAEAEKRAHQAEEERRAAEQAAPLARERALTQKRARLAAAIEEERRAAKLAAAQAYRIAQAAEAARLAAAAEEERRAAEQAAASAAEALERAQAEEQARLAAAAEEDRRAAEQAAALAAAEALERAQAEEQARLAAAAEEERRAAEQAAALAAAEALERAQAEEQARLAAAAEEEGRQAAAPTATAEPLREQASDSSQVVAPRMEAAASRTGATQSEAQTPGAGLGHVRALPAVAIAAALVVAAGAVAAFMNRGSAEVGPASGGASSGTSSGRSVQMLRTPTTVSSTISASSTDGPVRSLPASAVAPSPSEAVPVVAEPSDSTALWVARQLAGGPNNASSSSLDLSSNDSWLAGVQALAAQPRVAVMRYDVLQAAREAPRSARVPDLEVIAPIGTEPLFFVVRLDSPLRFIHELQGRAINVGAADGSRALTARNAYHLLFDDWPAASAGTALDESAALDRLASDRSLDAVAVLGASPLSALARRAPLAAHGLRLLALDANRPTDQRLLATFLSIPVSDPALSGKQRMTTPGIVSFLVTARGSPENHAQHDDFVRTVAGSLCANWTAIGQSRAGLAISPGLQADVGWPYAAAAQQALARCDDRSNTTAANPASPPTLSR